MRQNRLLPALALLIFLPAVADEGAAKATPRTDGKPTEQMNCCAGEGADKALCPKGKANKAKRRTATKAKTAKTAPASGTQAAAEASPAPGVANMVVTKDPETGELRPATAAEREKLFAGRAPQAAPVAPRVVVLPDGTKMVELGEETMSYAIATKAPDGSIEHRCVHGARSASEARTAGKPAPAPRAEER
ncbi:MAG: hypothetical protein NEA02_13860 [Thermoanaerobaculia bacterium]|nr:hypothetical protein [Thermoanaerobaculia bacterium]